MELGMVGLGRMGGNMARRLMRAGHAVVATRPTPKRSRQLVARGRARRDVAGRAASSGSRPARRLGDAAGRRAHRADRRRRSAAPGAGRRRSSTAATPSTRTTSAAPRASRSDGHPLRRRRHQRRRLGPRARLLHDDRRRGRRRATARPDLRDARARARRRSPRTPGREGRDPRAERGYIHCGPSGAGHFVKMVHNGIEYGLMQAYAEGFDILRNAGSPALPEDERLRPRPADIAEVWRRGSVVSSWLLDLTARGARPRTRTLAGYPGHVEDSGEGRWTIKAAIEEAVPGRRARRGALRPLPLAPGAHLRREDAVGHAQGSAATSSRPREAGPCKRRAGRRDAGRAPAPGADPCTFVIFGATGDLTQRLLVPALYNLAPRTAARRGSPSSASAAADQTPRRVPRRACRGGFATLRDPRCRPRHRRPAAGPRCSYMRGELRRSRRLQRLSAGPRAAERSAHGTGGNALFYLATAAERLRASRRAAWAAPG